MYFYKTGNSWVLGETPSSFMPAGKYFLKKKSENNVSILPFDNNIYTERYFNKSVTQIMKNEAGDLYASMAEFLTAVADFFADASTGGSGGDATTLQTHPASYFQTALGFTPEQAGVAASLINTVKGGVGTEGDTLKKLYDLLISGYSEITLPTIAARNAYNITKLPTSILVTDDGDGRWALYKATSTGIGATYIKISDPDLLNAVMTASQIAAAYESLADVNRFTNALKQSVIDSATWIATNTLALLAHLVDSVSHITNGERTTWNAKLTASKAAIEGLLTGVITTHSHIATSATITSNTSIDGTYTNYLSNGTNLVHTLPLASNFANKEFSIVNNNSTPCTLIGTVQGDVNPLVYNRETLTIFCDGTSFYIK